MKRYSRQRDAVYDTLCTMQSHPTALQIYDAVRRQLPNISLATVYRNLNRLVEDGKAIMLLSSDSVEHYDAMTRRHCHMCCEKCNRVYDIDSEIDVDLKSIHTDHRIHSVSIMYYGICSQCLE